MINENSQELFFKLPRQIETLIIFENSWELKSSPFGWKRFELSRLLTNICTFQTAFGNLGGKGLKINKNSN